MPVILSLKFKLLRIRSIMMRAKHDDDIVSTVHGDDLLFLVVLPYRDSNIF